MVLYWRALYIKAFPCCKKSPKPQQQTATITDTRNVNTTMLGKMNVDYIRARISSWSGIIVLLALIHMLAFVTLLFLAGIVQYASAYGTIAFHALHPLIYFMCAFMFWNVYNIIRDASRLTRPVSLWTFFVILVILGILNIIYIVRALIDTFSCSAEIFCYNAYGSFVTSIVLSAIMLLFQIIMLMSIFNMIRFFNAAMGNPNACCIASDAKKGSHSGEYNSASVDDDLL
jgi:hypothetical protein